MGGGGRSGVVKLLRKGVRRVGGNAKTKTLMVLVDFSRAYDRVWKDGLLAKMLKLGIPPHMAKWASI